MPTWTTLHPSPVGPLRLVVDDAGRLTILHFGPERVDQNAETDAGRCAHVAQQLKEYFRGERRSFDLELDLERYGTAFQHSVWRELLRIPFGATISYTELAQRVGRPAAVRAVGQANGKNPIAVVVPCHRVIGADGSLTGFGGGIDNKVKLLELEGSLPRSLWST